MAVEIAVYRPETVLTNRDIASWGITSGGESLTAQSIYKKVGVEQRYLAKRDETVLNMGIQAVQTLSLLSPPEMVFFSTSYPDGINNASELVRQLNLSADGCINVHAACSGFTLSLNHIFNNIDRFSGKRILLVASEKYSPTLINLESGQDDPSLSQTIFSDGAAAIAFTEGEDLTILNVLNHSFPEEESFCLRMPINDDLVRHPALTVGIPISDNGCFWMDGKKVYENVIRKLPGLVVAAIKGAELERRQIKMVIPHQASRHMLEALAKRLPGLQVYSDLEDGNWSSASIPKAMLRALQEGVIGSGDKIVLAGFGAGLFASVAVVELI